MNDKDTIDDLSTLFLPDLHHNNDLSIKQEFAIDDFDELKQSSFVNFNNFLSNNQFISYKQDDLSFNQSPSNTQPLFQQSPYQQPQLQSSQQPQSQQSQPQPQQSHQQQQILQQQQPFQYHPEPIYGQHGHFPYLNHNHYSNFVPEAARQVNMTNHCIFPQRTSTADWINQDHLLQTYVTTNGQILPNNGSTGDGSTAVSPKKKKAKSRRKPSKSNDFVINYNPHKLKRLLDLKKLPQTNNFTIVDKNNNPIKIGFNGFLNGKFLTNDTDNCTYILTKHNIEGDNSQSNIPTKQNPQVILCYRRNYIQISMNMNISGLKSNTNNKILRLQTSEYGYTITRVIKYFKLEIMAKKQNKNSDVPISIKSVGSKKDASVSGGKVSITGTKDRTSSVIDDNIIFDRIVKPEHIILLNNDETVDQGSINKYFLIKKLQFKNATPNNGSLTFQNYYHLIVKLLAVVADLYYDDYVDEEFNNGLNGANTDNNEVVLAELTSDPIIVRGRNPNFYTERNDILIKGRSNISKKSFELASQDKGNDDDNYEEDDDAGEDAGEVYNEENFDEENNNDDYEVVRKSDKNVGNNSDGNEEADEADDLIGFDEDEQEDNENAGELDDNEEEDNSDHTGGSTNQTSPLEYTLTSEQNDLTGSSKYKYFPISRVYYLPPINAVYFPHGAHQHQPKEVVSTADEDLDQQVPESRKKRKSSNVYFK